MLREEIKRVWEGIPESTELGKYGGNLTGREGIKVAWVYRRTPDERYGLKRGIRGRKIRSTIPDESANKPADLVCRNFTALRPNQLWVADLIYVAVRSGFVCAAFVIDTFARFIVGCRDLNL